MTKPMEKADLYMPTKTYTKEIGPMTKPRGMARIFTTMEQSMKGFGRRISSMGRAWNCGLMAQGMKVNTI